MSRFSLRVARLFGQGLPAFASRAEAERSLFAQRDEGLAAIERAAERSAGAFIADYSPESLKALEAWYFRLCERRGFEDVGTSRDEFEHWMAWYYGATAVRSDAEAEWIVAEFPFEPGRYELGVRKGPGTEMLTAGFTDHHATINNARREHIYRRYRDHYV